MAMPEIPALPAADRIEAQFQLSLPGTAGNRFRLEVEFMCPGAGVTALFGPSGSGKTTLLRCIAGLQPVTAARLTVNGETWHDERINKPAHERPVGYVFQEASLFPHLHVQGNLHYARRRANEPIDDGRYRQIIELMGIERLLHRRPEQLSGGERQRVAIARALLISPRLLLMDEPLAALETARKREILPYLEALHSEFSLPVLYVTHALDEVAQLADYLVILENGAVAVQGNLQEVLSRVDLPVDLGEDSGVVLQGRVCERDSSWHLARVSFAGGQVWVPDDGDAVGTVLRLRILARDVSLSLEARQQSSIVNRLPCRVLVIAEDRDPAMALVRLQLGAEENAFLLARISRRSVHELNLTAGSRVWAQIKSVAILR